MAAKEIGVISAAIPAFCVYCVACIGQREGVVVCADVWCAECYFSGVVCEECCVVRCAAVWRGAVWCGLTLRGVEWLGAV